MAQMKTYRCWFKDDSMIMACAIDEAAAKKQAEKQSREYLKDAYFETATERKQASTVKSVECLD